MKTIITLLKELNPGDLIEVGWWDAIGGGGWHSDGAVQEYLNNPNPGAACATMGYYYGHNSKRIVMCGSMGSTEGGEWGDIVVVPVVNIAKLELLKKAETLDGENG